MIAPGKAEKKAARTARLSAALRENLKRRKAQARGRSQSPDPGEGPAEAETSGPSPAGAAKTSDFTPDFRRNRGNG
jgi:hypothetical protein